MADSSCLLILKQDVQFVLSAGHREMNIGDITFNHIRILKAVDDSRGFSQAAKELGYSQALVSKKIKQLEVFFGTSLVTRTPGAIKLTNSGKRLISKTMPICNDLESLKNDISKPIDSLGEEIAIGITPLLSASWIDKFFHRFAMCFPNKEIHTIETASNDFSLCSTGKPKKIDLIINSTSAYQENHPCNRLQTYRFVFVNLSENAPDIQGGPISLREIDFGKLTLLSDICHELKRSGIEISKVEKSPKLIDEYKYFWDFILTEKGCTIIPEFCLEDVRGLSEQDWTYIHDLSEFGVYIHVPPLSELLVLAEGLVRSFRLEQKDPQSYEDKRIFLSGNHSKRAEILRIGVQIDSIGQLIASYGVKYINRTLRSVSQSSNVLKDLNIFREFEIDIKCYPSGELMNRQMRKGELDICIMDDMSLLNNGSSFFDGLNFYSKLISIASYNLIGKDICIVVPKKSDISSVKDLAGKRISTLFGSNSHRYLITLLDIYSIDVNSHCFLINEDPRTASNSLSNGNIDAHVCCETYATLLENHNFSKRLSQDDNDGIKIPSLRGIVCRSHFIRDNPEVVISYLHDLVIANQWFLQNQINGIQQLNHLTSINSNQTLRFYSNEFGTRIDPTLKPQWSWLLKTLNRRLEGKYGIAKFDVDFWIDDYLLRLIYNSLGLDYHFQQVAFSSEFSRSYFTDEKFGEYMDILNSNGGGHSLVTLA
ncbi:LysR family transcriptional regulator [Leptolyngbya sp. KIOST-1]|uniref:LysR family transcriptional regulator n=1 Tax=Leptolyngbya sp. KIOST-1 TaxID=1229172 RepID=UPI000A78287B|nr:LysR family transcriptional regulator [Leptolyngbya sp. KIOST-1]